MKAPSVLIGLPTRAYVQAQTVTTLFSLTATPGVKVALAVKMGSTIHAKRNAIVRLAIERGDDYVLFVDSDSQFPADTLSKMIALDKDIVGLVYARTYAPYAPNVSESRVNKKGKFQIRTMLDFDRDKPSKVWSVGTGTMLIKTEVFKKMKDLPEIKGEWFQFTKLHGIPIGEDNFFCHQAGKAGFEVWIDPTIKTMHWDNYGFSLADFDANKENI